MISDFGRNKMVASEQIVRPRRTPPKLAASARTMGIEPRDLVVSTLRSYPTFAEAADALGVNVLTLRRWREFYGLEVAK